MNNIPYEKHLREYTVLGVTAALDGWFTKEFIDFFGLTLTEIISVIENGIYYHLQREGEREKLAKSFLKRFDEGKIDTELEYEYFDKEVAKYTKLINIPTQGFTLNTLIEFYKYYRSLMKMAAAALDTADFIDVLSPTKQTIFFDWITKVRKRAEPIYKTGERLFIPRYSEWLSKTILPDYTSEELLYLTSQEMEAYITKGAVLPPSHELTQRKELLYIRQFPIQQFEIKTNQEARVVIEKNELLIDKVPESNVSEVKGQSAYPGVVKGSVRIVLSLADSKNIKEGEVLVSTMTDPSYLPAMKRAIAFITDEGGILSHAAIVARELKKPCVIGTKIATKILKDGDLVEVDANTGRVRIING